MPYQQGVLPAASRGGLMNQVNAMGRAPASARGAARSALLARQANGGMAPQPVAPMQPQPGLVQQPQMDRHGQQMAGPVQMGVPLQQQGLLAQQMRSTARPQAGAAPPPQITQSPGHTPPTAGPFQPVTAVSGTIQPSGSIEDLLTAAGDGNDVPVFGDRGIRHATQRLPSGLPVYTGGTGLIADFASQAAAPGNALDPADRLNLSQASQFAQVAQDKFLEGESRRRNQSELIGRMIEDRESRLIDRNNQLANQNLAMQYGNLNDFTGNYDQRRNAQLGVQDALTGDYGVRARDVLGDSDAAQSILQQNLIDSNRQQGDVRGQTAQDFANRGDDIGAIQRGYGFRSQDIGDTLRALDASMSRRQGHLNTGQTELQRRQGLNTERGFGEQAALDTGYENRIGDIMSLLNLRGREASSDIERGANRQRAQSTSDLASRGLYNTTVTDSARRGIEEDRARQQRGLQEQLREQEIGLLGGLSREALENRRQTSDTRNQLNQQVISQADRNLARQQQAHADTVAQQRGTAQARSGLQADALRDRTGNIGLLNQMTQQLGGLDERGIGRQTAAEAARAQAAQQHAGLRAGVTGETLASGQQGIDARREYDLPLMQQSGTMLDRLAQSGMANQATDTALSTDLSSRTLGYLLDEMRRSGQHPNFLQLMNIVQQGGSESPVPIQATPQTSSFQGSA